MKNTYKQEFNVGDTVNFVGYEGQRKSAKVTGVTVGSHFLKDDERVFYDLSGEVVSHCTGKSIEGSQYLVDHSVDYTGRQFRDVDGEMWTCLSDWSGNFTVKIEASNGTTTKPFEACDIHRFEK
jgi:hypothetical protein